ncbi:FAST kinase domain-containing protein 3, mitochondrial isoform X2 [Scleropages formosus]|uniref:FAST kinase domains 3 n=1 Tax=Scleropages formosus TaxID=113540 RepID=A0A8C9QQU3_SCLFO|nr:FAST kinase domain-containing protein 3, mitochondrial isoform X2 [Scleropages formosus]
MTFIFMWGLHRQSLRALRGVPCLSQLLLVCPGAACSRIARVCRPSGLVCGALPFDGGRVALSTIIRDPLTLGVGSVCLHGDATHRFLLTQSPGPTATDEHTFVGRLHACDSSKQLLRLLQSAAVMMSDTMAAAVLHRIADVEREGRGLRNPEILQTDEVGEICCQLERESTRLTDAGLVSALLACTRLYVDPWSTLMVRLISESQERLDQERLTAAHLCTLGEALLALEGPGCGMLHQVMEQVGRQSPSDWSLDELIAVYGLLQSGANAGSRYQELLNAMNTYTVSIATQLDPTAVSKVLSALVVLNQTQALPLVISLCKNSVSHVPRFSDAELTIVLGALMHFGHSERFFVEALERRVTKTAFTAHPETVSKAMQYFGRRNILSVPVFDAVAESFVYRADDYSTSQIARQIMPFGKLGYLPPNGASLFRKVEAILHSRFSQFQPRTLLNLLHSCTLIERFPLNFVAKVFSPYFLQQLQEQGTGMDRIVLSQLTQIYLTVKLECPFYTGPNLYRNYRVKSFLTPGRSLETPVEMQLYNSVKAGLVNLFGARSYFASRVLTPYCYTLDVEIKLDEEGYVLPASSIEEVFKRIAVCIDGQNRFSTNTRKLLGREAMKQRHLRLLGYEVVQIPFYEFEMLSSKADIVEYLHKKIFPRSYRLSW